MLTPALLLHASLLSLSQMAGLVRSPLDTMSSERPPWDWFAPGSQIVQKGQAFDSAGIQIDSSRLELFILPDRRVNAEFSSQKLTKDKSGLRESYWGFELFSPADSMRFASRSDSTKWTEQFFYRKQVTANGTRWITTPGPAWKESAPFDTTEQFGTSASALQVRREVEPDGTVRTDSLWRTPDGLPLRATESVHSPLDRSYSVRRRTHGYNFQNGLLVADTVWTTGLQGGQGHDTTMLDILRYTWENGRLTGSTSSKDTVRMEWTASGLPVRYVRRNWTQTTPTPDGRRLDVTERKWDALGRSTTTVESDEWGARIDSSEYVGTIPFASRSLYLRCGKPTPEPRTIDRSACTILDYEVYQTEISGVPVRSIAKGIRQSSVRMEGKKAIFQNLSIPAGMLEMVSLDGKLLAKTSIADGQATLPHPGRGVTLWQVRTPDGTVVEASRLILP